MIMKKIVLSLILLSAFHVVHAQRYITKTGYVSFYSDTPMEKIEAQNHEVNCAMDTGSGFFVVKILMRSFLFEKALMQEHFNEEYVESDKYPNAFFKGKVTNLKEIGFSKPGTYPAVIEGEMTIHGKTNKMKAKGTFIVSKEGIRVQGKFPLKIADYGISVPGAVTGKIAEVMEITTDFHLKPLNK